MPDLRYSTPEARRLMRELVTLRGLSYADAIAECERRAIDAVAPYREVAAILRDELASPRNQQEDRR